MHKLSSSSVTYWGGGEGEKAHKQGWGVRDSCFLQQKAQSSAGSSDPGHFPHPNS